MYNEKISILLKVKRKRIKKLQDKRQVLNGSALDKIKDLDSKIERLSKEINSLEKLEKYVK